MSELKFSTYEEAMIHLANLTGKTIKVAEKKYKLDVTYAIISPESAEHGDYEDTGVEDKNVTFNSLYEMIDYLIDNGATEPSSSSYHEGVWYSTEAETDYRTGDETTYSYHLDYNKISDEEGKTIFDSIKSGKNLAEEE